MRISSSLVCAAALALAGSASAQTTHDVDVFDFGYTPATLTIQVGDTVRFTNSGALLHTSTEDGFFNGNEAFRENLAPGQQASVVFDAAFLAANPRLCNTYGYFCEPHPFMVATIIVEPVIGNSYCPSNANSTGQGAEACANGSLDIGDNNINFTVDKLPQNKIGYFLMSENSFSLPGFGGSQGILCVAPPLYRFNAFVLQSGTTGTFQFSPDVNALPQGQVFMTGESWYFQCWYRDNNPTSTSNTTNGIELIFL